MPSETRPAQLEAELTATRTRVAADAKALRAKLTPAGLAQEAKTRLQGSHSGGSGLLGAQSGGWGRAFAEHNSALTTLLGAGLAWLLLRSSKHREEV